MAARLFSKSTIARRLLTVVVIGALALNGSAWGGFQRPLGTVPVPEPPNLSQFVKDKAAAVRLGKALFWDMQVGSDGIQACATCHYRAGADPITDTQNLLNPVTRAQGQLHPGPDTLFGNNSTVINGIRVPGNIRFSAGYALNWFDFPLFNPIPAENRLLIDPLTLLTQDPVTVFQDTNDVVGSQGVRKTLFDAIVPGSPVESGTLQPDPVFTVGGVTKRQVTGRNSPSVINAVFNYTNFWDGRANNIFNGENPFGPLDPNAGIWVDAGGAALEKQKVAIPNASLASQATGPPLSDVEMSFIGRTFPELGRKMLSLTRPLDLQLVHPGDSVLGLPLARASLQADGTVTGNTGLNTSYDQMIRDAFVDTLWNSPRLTPDGYSQMEANFALFFGLAVQLYEATLVSDRTPFDRFQAGNQNAMNADAQNGLATFDSKCAVCHSGSELTSAVVGRNDSALLCVTPDCNRLAFTNNSTHHLIQQDVNLDTFVLVITDLGFMNIGVRPSADDPGRGGGAPFVNPLTGQNFPLSFTELAKLADQGKLPFVTPKLPIGTQATPVSVKGAFKVPGLRNVELTAPYFHNGDAFDLQQVVEFYTRGGNFPNPSDNQDLASAMQPIRNLRGNTTKQTELVAFLKALTDERVRNETAPFDHPELRIPKGDPADTMLTLPPTGGVTVPAPPVFTLNPVVTPTGATGQTIGGTVDSTGTVEVSVNGGVTAFATIPCPLDPNGICVAPPPISTWSYTLTGLPVGLNSITVTATSITGGTATATAQIQVLPTATISGVPSGGRTTQKDVTLTIGGNGIVSYRYSLDGGAFSSDIPVATPVALTGLADATYTVAVLGRDGAGNEQLAAAPTLAVWTVKANPPVLTLNPVTSPFGNKPQTIGGTVELGSVPSVTVNTAATVGPVTIVPTGGLSTWSCTISGLVAGTNTITVKAFDFVFNLTTVSGTITVIPPDGNFKGVGEADVSDALKALRFAVGLDQPSAIDMLHGDVAPLVSGVPAPDNTIDIADALVILKKVVKLIQF